ncbi:MAG TPA: TolC family protein [Victivallales bacterium]|nr:TolC family protein [Victivallales bacterium]
MRLLKFTAYAFGCALFAISSGCVSYKPPPDVIHANNYTAESESEQRRLPADNRVLTVNEAINIALANNPTYQIARLNMISFYAIYYKSLSVFSPTLGINYGQTWTQGRSSGNSRGTRGNSSTGYLGMNYTAFNGMQDVFGALEANASAKAEEYAYRNARRILVKNARVQYYSILLDRANIQIDLGNEIFQEQMVNDEQLKYDAGASSLSDVLNFKILRNDAQTALIQAKAQYQIDRYLMAQIMGLTTADIPPEVRFPPIEVVDNSEFSMGVEFYLDLAINQRPDLRGQKETLKAAKYALYKSWGAFSPTVSISMDYGFSAGSGGSGAMGGAMAPTGPDGSNTYNYGWSSNWVLWEGGSRIFDVRSNMALYDVQKETLLKRWIEVVTEVRHWYVHLNMSIAVRKIQAQTLQLARQFRDLVREEYNAGNQDIAFLNQAQQKLIKSESVYVSAVIQVAVDRAKLAAACGGIKDF